MATDAHSPVDVAVVGGGMAGLVVANRCPAALRWLINEGVSFAPSRAGATFRWQVTPHGVNVGRRIHGDRGTYRMVRRLYANLRARGASVVHDSRATGLEPSDDGWRLSVTGSLPGHSVTARHVVLCDGGFQASKELLTRHVGPRAAERCFEPRSPVLAMR